MTEFKDPFRTGFSIVEKILHAFFTTTNRDKINAATTKAALIHNLVRIKTCTIKEFCQAEIPKIESDKLYWLLLFTVPGGANFQVYDASPKPLLEMVSMSLNTPNNCFCIVDKKYQWLIFCEMDTEANTVNIFLTDKTTELFTNTTISI